MLAKQTGNMYQVCRPHHFASRQVNYLPVRTLAKAASAPPSEKKSTTRKTKKSEDTGICGKVKLTQLLKEAIDKDRTKESSKKALTKTDIEDVLNTFVDVVKE